MASAAAACWGSRWCSSPLCHLVGGLGSSMGIEDEGERRDLEEALVEVKEHDEAFYVLVLGRDADR